MMVKEEFITKEEFIKRYGFEPKKDKCIIPVFNNDNIKVVKNKEK